MTSSINQNFRIDRVTTKTGDQGQTSVADGKRIPKDSQRISAIGDIDELNSLLGVLISTLPADLNLLTIKTIRTQLTRIQHELFEAGGELAIPGSSRIHEIHIAQLESEIEIYLDQLPALQEFILPGGSYPASLCHLTRSVSRRAERTLVHLHHEFPQNPTLLIYFNRLSDWLFVLARILNLSMGQPEVFWKSS